MNRSAVGAAAVVVLAVVAAGVLVGGFSPGDAPGGPSDGTTGPDVTSSPDATGTSSTTTAPGSTATSDATTAPDATTASGNDATYDFTIERVAECGTTCRNVTARLANGATEPRDDVRVTTGVFADGDLLWRGNETVGRLAPGEAHNTTKRVELGLAGAMAVQDNDGYVTIVTVVQSADGTERFEERRKVG